MFKKALNDFGADKSNGMKKVNEHYEGNASQQTPFLLRPGKARIYFKGIERFLDSEKDQIWDVTTVGMRNALKRVRKWRDRLILNTSFKWALRSLDEDENEDDICNPLLVIMAFPPPYVGVWVRPVIVLPDRSNENGMRTLEVGGKWITTCLVVRYTHDRRSTPERRTQSPSTSIHHSQ